MILENAFKQYKMNFKASLAFGLLLVFVLLFSVFPNTFIGSGSIFLEYSFPVNLLAFGVELFAFIVFMVFYSFFVSLIVFSVKRNLSTVKLHFYLNEMIQKFTSRIFLFNFLFSLVLIFFAAALVVLGVHILAVNLILLAAAIAFIFVPQAIVVDEPSIRRAIFNNFEFILENPRSVALIVVVGSVLVGITLLIEFAFDFFQLVGRYVSLLIMLVFVLPFMETLKTYLYLFKYDLIKNPETIQEREKPRPKPFEIVKRTRPAPSE